MTYQLSVLLYSSNQANNLFYTCSSLSKQSLKREFFEVILLNDGSTDQTESLMLKTLNQLNGEYLHFEKKVGIGPALNEGLKLASGKYILLLNDAFLPAIDVLETHLNALKTHNNPQVMLLGNCSFTPEKSFLLIHQLATYLNLLFPSWNLPLDRPCSFDSLMFTNLSFDRQGFINSGQSFDSKAKSLKIQQHRTGYELFKSGFKLFYEPRARLHCFRDYEFSQYLETLTFEVQDIVDLITDYPILIPHYFAIPALTAKHMEEYRQYIRDILPKMASYIAQINQSSQTIYPVLEKKDFEKKEFTIFTYLITSITYRFLYQALLDRVKYNPPLLNNLTTRFLEAPDEAYYTIPPESKTGLYLNQLYREQSQQTTERNSFQNGETYYELARFYVPTFTLQTSLSSGVEAIMLLQGLKDNFEQGVYADTLPQHLVFQRPQEIESSNGCDNIEAVHLTGFMRLEDKSIEYTYPDLSQNHFKFQLALIIANQSLHQLMNELYLVDQLLCEGGILLITNEGTVSQIFANYILNNLPYLPLPHLKTFRQIFTFQKHTDHTPSDTYIPFQTDPNQALFIPKI